MFAIKIENLNKKYLINHNNSGYRTFREDMVNLPQTIINRTIGKSKNNIIEEFWALKNINVQIEKGDRIGIIGHNGAGKSTLLKILSKITTPTDGKVTINGKLSSLLEVGTGFHPELTGRENIYLNGSILGMKRKEIDKKFADIVEFSEVERFLDTPVKKYSSGMYIKLAFSVAAHLDPDILIIDEVLSVGDAQFQKKSIGKMKNINSDGKTVIFVSHNLAAVKSFCNKVILMNEGEIIYFGDTQEALNMYLGEYHYARYKKIWNEKDFVTHSYIKLISISVVDANFNDLTSIDIDTSFYIKIDFENFSNLSNVGFTLNFYDEENNIIFSSINNNEKNWYGKSMTIGIYSTYCKIPENLLNNGWYSVGLTLFGKNFSDAKSYENVLLLELHDGINVRNDFFGDFGGVIRPLLEWTTIKT